MTTNTACSCGLAIEPHVCNEGRGCPLRDAPMRRPPDILPLGTLWLALTFVLGSITGAAAVLVWF